MFHLPTEDRQGRESIGLDCELPFLPVSRPLTQCLAQVLALWYGEARVVRLCCKGTEMSAGSWARAIWPLWYTQVTGASWRVGLFAELFH